MMNNKKTLTTLAASLGLAAVSNAALVHRYSFDTDATDSIGGAHGTLQGDANVLSGAVQLDGTGDHVALDATAIAINGFTDVTIEAWWSHDTQDVWQRVFDFGDTNGAGAGQNYMFYSPVGNPGGAPDQYAAIANGGTSEQGVQLNPRLANGSYHMAMTFDDAANTMTLYVDGVQVAQNTGVTNTLGGLSNAHAYLGKSSWNADTNNLNGSIDEFRIYNNALSGAEVASSFALGADAVPEPSSTALLGLGGLALILRRRK